MRKAQRLTVLAGMLLMLPSSGHVAQAQERTAATQRVVFGVEVRRQIAADSTRLVVKYQGSGSKRDPQNSATHQDTVLAPRAREQQQRNATKTEE